MASILPAAVLSGQETTMMSTKDFLLDLFAHMECADASIWTAVLGHPPAAADAQLKGYLLHLHTVQRAFLDAWTGQPIAFRQQFEDATLEGEYQAVRSYYQPARAFLSSLADAALGDRFVLPWVEYVEKALNRPAAPTTLGETVMQVVSHTTRSE